MSEEGRTYNELARRQLLALERIADSLEDLHKLACEAIDRKPPGPEPKPGTFEWAMGRMREGKAVRRKFWAQCGDSDVLRMVNEGHASQVLRITHPADPGESFPARDLDDWVFYDDWEEA